MRDFTLTIYKKILFEFLQVGYRFVSFGEFIQNSDKKEGTIILRHDVDRLPEQALKMARIEHGMRVKASYYFRCHRHGFDESVIRSVAALGHEIGYHYEDLSHAQGNFEKAITAFEKNLAGLRKLAEIKTICMHGNPLGNFDNRKLWERYDYRNFGIIFEPYFDIDYSNVFYITDTGRKWNSDNSNIRDKVNSGNNIRFRNTNNLILLIKFNKMPKKLVINVHPQRWNNKFFPWAKELIWQNMKNKVKYFLVNR